MKVGKLELKAPKSKGTLFESAVIERYRRREKSVEKSFNQTMYPTDVPIRRVDVISQALR